MRLELIFGIHRATHRIGLYIQRHAPDLTQAEAHILCHLHEFGDERDVRPASRLRAQAFDADQRAGPAGCARTDPRESSRTDRRSFVVRLTAAGKKKAARIHRQLESLEAEVLRANDPGTVETFGKVIRNLEDAAAEQFISGAANFGRSRLQPARPAESGSAA